MAQRLKSVFIIGVAGGTASGKTSVCERIIAKLNASHERRNSPQLDKRVIMISQDSFYRDLLNEADKKKASKGDYNFDHPNSFDHELLIQVLNDLRDRKPVEIPQYDFLNHARKKEKDKYDAADVILVEGILIFHEAKLREIFDMKLFVDADPDIRLARRVQRDTSERGRQLDNVLHQYLNLVKPAFDQFCHPTKKYSDVIIPNGSENEVAIDLIVKHIDELLRSDTDGSTGSGDSRPEKRKTSQSVRPH
ncbi:Uridine kinase [Aphelenchoides besseyi]|nr:Uridine kinase [Aphelenchoides besseyi]KAI6232318.1 Uridine kinase [Aphelenchoides besseyi]